LDITELLEQSPEVRYNEVLLYVSAWRFYDIYFVPGMDLKSVD